MFFCAVCLSAFVLVLTMPAGAQTVVASSLSASDISGTKSAEEIEYDVKAAFIFNFMRFIDWPEKKLISNREYQKQNDPGTGGNSPLPMIIGIVGKNPFGKAFAPILDKKIGDRSIQLVQLDSYEPYMRAAGGDTGGVEAYRKKYGVLLSRCDMLFFSTSESSHYEKLLPLTAQAATVTISDIPNFALRGGMIGFVIDNKRVRFDINLESVDKESVKIRSQLLELARQVHKKSGSRR